MNKTITRLSDEQVEELKTGFKKNLGRCLEEKRKILNLTQAELADCLDMNRADLSKYENGDRDLHVSMLPLFSAYCKFPLSDLFPEDESQAILDTFSCAVIITVERKNRQEQLRKKKAARSLDLKQHGQEKILKGQVYDIHGQEVFEPVPDTQKPKSMRLKYKDAEMHTEYEPYSEAEFCDYVRDRGDWLVSSVIAAGQFLRQIEGGA